MVTDKMPASQTAVVLWTSHRWRRHGPGALQIQDSAADQASCSMLHAIGCVAPSHKPWGRGSSGSGRLIGGRVAAVGPGLQGEVSSPELLHPPVFDQEDAVGQVQE